MSTNLNLASAASFLLFAGLTTPLFAGGVHCSKVCKGSPSCLEQCYAAGGLFAGYMDPDMGQPCLTDQGQEGMVDIRGFCVPTGKSAHFRA